MWIRRDESGQEQTGVGQEIPEPSQWASFEAPEGIPIETVQKRCAWTIQAAAREEHQESKRHDRRLEQRLEAARLNDHEDEEEPDVGSGHLGQNGSRRRRQRQDIPDFKPEPSRRRKLATAARMKNSIIDSGCKALDTRMRSGARA